MAEPKKAKLKAPAPSTKKKAETKPKSVANPSRTKSGAKAAPRQKSPPKAAAPKKSKATSSSEIYTDPKLRDRLKEEIIAGDKGGKPGQWSARKAQLLASEYEKAGGDYKNGKKKTASQRHLDSWTEEDWKTSDGEPADRDGGTARYLPAEAWDRLTPAEKNATDAKKQAGSRRGKQFVANTGAAKEARKAASSEAQGESDEADRAAGAKPKAKSRAAAKPKAPKRAKK